MAKIQVAANHEILEAALLGLQSQREKLDAQIAHVRSLLGGKTRSAPSALPAPAAAASTKTSTRRQLSPEARKRIAAAQKKRWAAFRKNQK